MAQVEESDYSLQEIITIASLIEEETDGTDQANIASVIYNRLEGPGDRQGTYGLLQIDASLLYALPDHTGPITSADMQTDSPYNLYQNAGLPPTPISNPGLASIDAALNPDSTDYYYYALGTDGLAPLLHHPGGAQRLCEQQLLWRLSRDKPELLAPAGDMERLKMAVLYGADAVYLAGTSFGMRAFAGNFSDEELPEAVAFAHSHGVRVHCTINTMPRNDEVARLPEHLERLNDAGVDALIVADLGAFTLAGKYAPRCQRHISTQASICNYETARAWHDLGASRVILARELSLEEIRTIRDRTPADLEIEAFVHGAMCVSYSGRCLLSNYMTGRDSSRGACAQPCRYQYALVEEKRPGEYFPVFEDAQGTYILNSRDMCMIDHLEDLCGAGLSSLKIEGRAKSAYYAAIVTGAYRHCLDAAAAGEPVDPVWRDEVEHVSHRPYSTGFYYGPPGQYYATSRYVREWQVAAVVTDCDSAGHAVLSLRNKFRAGDTVEIVGPDLRPFSMTVPEMRDEAGAPLEEPRNPQMKFYMDLPKAVPPYSLVRRGVDLSAK